MRQYLHSQAQSDINQVLHEWYHTGFKATLMYKARILGISVIPLTSRQAHALHDVNSGWGQGWQSTTVHASLYILWTKDP